MLLGPKLDSDCALGPGPFGKRRVSPPSAQLGVGRAGQFLTQLLQVGAVFGLFAQLVGFASHFESSLHGYS